MESILLPSAGFRRRHGTQAPLPVVGEIYNYYDDGKIRISRQLKALVTKIVPFDEVEETVKRKWEEDVNELGWCYADKTDFFIYLELTADNKKIDAKSYAGEPIPIVAVRDVNGEWSTGDFWWSGVLDVDGGLTDHLKERCVKEGYPYHELITMEEARRIFEDNTKEK